MLEENIEEKLKNKALLLTAQGRSGWDQRHTLRTVYWMRELIKTEGGDERVLVPAMYFHDTGYVPLRVGYNHKECLEAKPDHANAGALLAQEFLPTLDYFTDEEINEIVRLVKNHSTHNNIVDKNRQLVFEADSLGQMDWQVIEPTYDNENCLIFLDTTFKDNNIPFFRTESGKKILNEILPEAYNFVKERKE